jgi:hypothetical protein
VGNAAVGSAAVLLNAAAHARAVRRALARAIAVADRAVLALAMVAKPHYFHFHFVDLCICGCSFVCCVMKGFSGVCQLPVGDSQSARWLSQVLAADFLIGHNSIRSAHSPVSQSDRGGRIT